MDLLLTDIAPIPSPQDYKLHLACVNRDGERPLDVFVSDRDGWKGWNSFRGSVDRFNRRFVFALMDYHHRRDRWLFGGVFEILGQKGRWYDTRLTDQLAPLIGRLVLRSRLRMRQRSLRLERVLDSLVVDEVFAHCYAGETFPGFERLNVGFASLETIVRTQRADWKAALSSVQGVYLIVDSRCGRQYVGTTWSEGGIWSRWSQYAASGHGGNAELKKLLAGKGRAHARQHFHFAILESRPIATPKETMEAREAHWKGVLLTHRFGYN